MNRQARVCEVKAAELGATIVDWYHDEASAASTHRKGQDLLIERLLDDGRRCGESSTASQP